MQADSYHKDEQNRQTLKIREMLKDLPGFIREYFRGISDSTEPHTRLGYAYDLRIFFGFLSAEVLGGAAVNDISIEDMKNVTSENIEEFMEYLTYYIPKGETDTVFQNEAKGKSRKLAAVRGLFKYLYMKKHIPANPADLVAFPKIHGRVITVLEADEVARLLDQVESGEKLSPKQKQFHERTKIRDTAILTLLLGTGMRVSECVGLDIHHIDFETGGAKVLRKGGDEMVLYFGDEVEKALVAYLKTRSEILTAEGHEDALFLSLQNRRITVRAVQNLVKKYAGLITSLKNISPHKLRSTFGTALFQETGDIYLVANVLGHADVNTTRKHYAKMDDSYRRQARNAVRLRE